MTATGIDAQIAGQEPETLSQRDLHALHHAIESGGVAAGLQSPYGFNDSGYAGLLEELGTGVYRITPDGRLLFASTAFLRMLGFETTGEAEQTASQHADFLNAVVPESGMYTGNTSWCTADGSKMAFKESVRPIRSADGRPLYFEGMLQDITTEHRLSILERGHRKVLDLIAANASLDSILNEIATLVEQQVEGSRCVIRLLARSSHHQDARQSRPLAAGESGTCSNERKQKRSAASKVRACRVHGGCCTAGFARSWSSIIQTATGAPLGSLDLYVPTSAEADSLQTRLMQNAARLAGVAVQQRQMHDELDRQACSDRTTHLPNRYALSDRLGHMLRRGKTASKVALLWIGLDRFGGINDSVGHKTGDALLRNFSSRISGVLRKSEWLARVGNDEFAVICEGAGKAAAEECAQRILASLQTPFHLKNLEFFLTARVGIALSPEDASTAQLLQQNAAAAYSRARKTGVTGHLFYEHEVGASVRERLEIENDLRRAIQNGELRLYYQPQVDLQRNLIGMEALLRWYHPTRGILAPGHFIQIAEETGLIVQIGAWVIREACRQCAEWHKILHLPIKVAVNVSAMQFYFSDLPEIVRATLEETGVPPNCFEVELTETVIMRNAEESAKALHKLRALGVTVAIDDFGTGYSSLSYLQTLPVDLLKIDRSFLQHIHVQATGAVVQAITTMAHSMGLRVAAEGIESETQMDSIRSFGVDIAQGFLIGRPMPPDRAVEWVESPAAVALADAVAAG